MKICGVRIYKSPHEFTLVAKEVHECLQLSRIEIKLYRRQMGFSKEHQAFINKAYIYLSCNYTYL